MTMLLFWWAVAACGAEAVFGLFFKFIGWFTE